MSSSSAYPCLSIDQLAAVADDKDEEEPPDDEDDWKLFFSFWMLGLLNNSSYVIMLACAKSISEGGTALVFLANALPALAITASAPCWFHRVGYDTRLSLATVCMMLSFVLVASGSSRASSSGSSSSALQVQLLGVALGSAQGGLGEASLLALAGKSDGNNKTSSGASKGQCLTCFSSGTGMAGVFGFFWKWFWNDSLGFSLSTTLLLANALGIGYWMTFRYAMTHHQPASRKTDIAEATATTTTTATTCSEDDDEQAFSPRETQALMTVESTTETTASATTAAEEEVIPIPEMTGRQRFQLVLSLWPYMIPLFVVYAAEYALQSGTWTAIGFPLEDAIARDRFFEYSNWLYHAGGFISRSSGTLFTAPMGVLWLMPMLQTLNLGVFWYTASHPLTSALYQPAILYTGAVYTGLLGGAVYINGYTRICRDLPFAHREFALSATSVAESVGIVVADSLGLVIQACLYQINGLDGAIVACPMNKF
jgi:battenin